MNTWADFDLSRRMRIENFGNTEFFALINVLLIVRYEKQAKKRQQSNRDETDIDRPALAKDKTKENRYLTII